LRAKFPEHPLSRDLTSILVKAEGRKRHGGYQPFPLSHLSRRVVADASDAIRTGTPIRLDYPIRNLDRAFGARLSGVITETHGSAGLPEGTVDVSLSGTAGQSLGAWLSPGVSIRVEGVANDYVGKGMGGGVVAITPRPTESDETPQGAGNAVLYGATGGSLFIAGLVGQRFAVRNSGATAVIEGCSDHACEYMTGGTVLILGRVGRNFGAGMTGGTAYLWDPRTAVKAHLAATAPTTRRPEAGDLERIEGLIRLHYEHTGSRLAQRILTEGPHREAFWVIEGHGPVVLSEEVVTVEATVPG
jgi:glutamate synthase (NADPH/NADH) large chain